MEELKRAFSEYKLCPDISYYIEVIVLIIYIYYNKSWI